VKNKEWRAKEILHGVYTSARKAFGIAVAGGERSECVQNDTA